MRENTSPSLVSLALGIASHPEARIVVMGAAPAKERSLFARMNLKVRVLALSAVILPLAVIANGMGGIHRSTTDASLSNAQTQQPNTPSLQTTSAAAVQATQYLVEPSTLNKVLSTEQSRSSKLETALPNQGKGMTSYQIANALIDVDMFAALTTAIEDFKPRPYYDSGGLNVGMGYCITKRLSEYGPERIKKDLSDAGFAPSQIATLLKNKKSETLKIVVDPISAVRLLEITKEDYRSLAEAAIGKSTFLKLPYHKQETLSYLAYNTGKVGDFKKLIKAVIDKNDKNAMLNMNVSWRDKDGVVHVNDRLRAWMQAAWLGPKHLKRALNDPNSFESSIAQPHAEYAFAAIAGAVQIPNGLGLRDKVLAQRVENILKGNSWARNTFDEEKAFYKKPAVNIKGS